jgi:hypothetical protein
MTSQSFRNLVLLAPPLTAKGAPVATMRQSGYYPGVFEKDPETVSPQCAGSCGRRSTMCVTLIGITILGYTFGVTHGCDMIQALPVKAEPTQAPIVSEFWGEVREATDPDPDDPDRGIIYTFVDPETKLKRDAAQTCGDGLPDTKIDGDRLLVHIQQTRFDRAKDYAVICKDPAKVG